MPHNATNVFFKLRYILKQKKSISCSIDLLSKLINNLLVHIHSIRLSLKTLFYFTKPITNKGKINKKVTGVSNNLNRASEITN